MHPKVEQLAARFKAALDDVEAGRRRRQEAEAQGRAAARAAREKLLSDLAEFAQAVGHITVGKADGRLTLAWGGQSLTFAEVGDAGLIRVVMGDDTADAEASPIRIYQHPRLDGAWVLGVMRDGIEDVEPLFEAGLVHLLAEGLGMPRPEPAPPTAQLPLDELVPDP